MRIAATLTAFLAIGVSAADLPPVLRKAPELTIVEPSGKSTLLSSYKGKVCVIEFLYTTCSHCQAASQVFTKLYKELGPQGFQPIGVGFNDNAKLLVDGFVKQFQVPYPVGYTTSDTVLSYMGFSIMDRYMVPQVVLIDRKGMIRAQSPPGGDVNLQTEDSLRKLIEGLLKEGAPTSNSKTGTKKASAEPKKAS